MRDDRESRYLELIERTNRTDKFEMENAVAWLRERMISSAFDSVKNFWKLQKDSLDEIEMLQGNEGASVDYFVIPSFSGFPLNDGEPVASLSMLLKPRNDNTDLVSDDTYSQMSIFVEVPADTIFDENLEIDELPQPHRIAVEFLGSQGLRENYIIDLTGITPFVRTLEDNEEEIVTGNFIDELSIFMRGHLKIRDDVEVIPRLFRYMTEWKAQVQKTIHLRPKGAQELGS